MVPGHQNPDLERLQPPMHNGGPAAFGEHVDERMYVEDVEAAHQQQADIDSLKRHELERGSDDGGGGRHAGGRGQERVREQHFYRDGNAEVLRLVTRGEIEDRKEFAERAVRCFNYDLRIFIYLKIFRFAVSTFIIM